MATTSTATERPVSAAKAPCTTCSKPIGIVRCEGCQKLFCRLDYNKHRTELNNQLDELVVEHDNFQQTLKQTTEDPRLYTLIQRIDTWEKESKAKIRQAASEARHQIEIFAATNAVEISTRFREMAERLKKAREDDTHDERDLKRWAEQLEQLKQNFESPSSVSVEEEQGVFIAKMIVKDLETLEKRFDKTCGYVQVLENGLVALCSQNAYANQISQVRGKGEYSRGIHRIRFQIESYNNGFLFFGVNSKSSSLNTNAFNVASSYGWASGSNSIYMNGQCLNNHEGYTSDFKINDVIELELDCYRRLIRLRNERAKKSYELPIDLEKCPFPWMFNFHLNYANTRLRIIV